MPQTDEATRAQIVAWFGYEFSHDFACLKVLLSKGYTEKAGMIRPPSPSHYGPMEDYVLLKYLHEEWDYAFTREGA